MVRAPVRREPELEFARRAAVLLLELPAEAVRALFGVDFALEVLLLREDAERVEEAFR